MATTVTTLHIENKPGQVEMTTRMFWNDAVRPVLVDEPYPVGRKMVTANPIAETNKSGDEGGSEDSNIIVKVDNVPAHGIEERLRTHKIAFSPGTQYGHLIVHMPDIY